MIKAINRLKIDRAKILENRLCKNYSFVASMFFYMTKILSFIYG